MGSPPPFRLACCMCRRPIPLSQDVYALDAEWQRRFPDIAGRLACQRCAIDTNQWKCENPDGIYVAGHIPAAHSNPGQDFDSWSHVAGEGEHRAMVVQDPWSGLLQGAEHYLRRLIHRPGVSAAVAEQVQQVLDQWDTRG